MIRILEYSPAAEADVESAYDWYERQKRGLGAEFLEELARVDALIADQPEMFRKIRPNTRRANLQRFPYSIIYLFRPHGLVVAAVLHSSRDPEIWQRRL